MTEELKVITAVEAAQASGTQAALATVVRVKGSAYRREGTKMFIDANGHQVCMISGGCLEQEVGEIAQRVLATGEPVVHFFDLDEDVVWGLGLGCGGAVDVYVEPFDAGAENSAWLEAVKNQQAAALATVLSVEGKTELTPATRMYISEDGSTLGSLGETKLDDELVSFAKEKMSQLYPRSETRRYTLAGGGAADIFLDVNVPPPELVIFGAGHDAVPLARYAHDLGFKLSVVDARHAFVTEERFPHATLVRTHPSGFAEKGRGRRAQLRGDYEPPPRARQGKPCLCPQHARALHRRPRTQLTLRADDRRVESRGTSTLKRRPRARA